MSMMTASSIASVATADLKILFVNGSDAGGGGYRLATDLFNALRDRGHPMSLAVRFKQTDDADVFEIENDRYRAPAARAAHAVLRTHVTRANAGSRARSLRNRLAIVATEPRRALRAWQGYDDFDFPGTAHLLDRCPFVPDVVHVHIGHGNYLDLRQLAPLALRVPIVLTLHDYWFITGGCGYFCECRRWQTTCGACPQLDQVGTTVDRTRENRAAKESIYRRAAALYVTVPSRAVAADARVSILGGARLIEAVPNCYDGAIFHPRDRREARRRLGLPADALIVMLAAQNPTKSKFKDWPTMLAALIRVGAQHRLPRPLHAMVLGGTGEPLSIPGIAVRSIPFVDGRESLAWHYAAADVFLHSAREETWGLVITESMACGTPVIATGVGGIPDQVVEGVTGFLVPPQSPSAFADRIQQLLADDAAREQFGTAAARHARENFTAAHVAERYESFYARARADWLTTVGGPSV